MTANPWKNRVILTFEIKLKANVVPEKLYSIIYAINNYYIFRNMDNL